MTSRTEAPKVRVILVGVGGATCSGKTTLAKHLRSCLPNSFIIHQDDFAPPQELIPYHPVYNVQDWDDPTGAIDWPRLNAFLREVKATGVLPDHHSHDHLNEQREVHIDRGIFDKWQQTFRQVEQASSERGEKIVWAILDGFLLYWDQAVIDSLDVRIFLRVPHDILKARRDVRHGYHTAEGTLWRDPPHYWEQIVYPAYLRAHADIFQDGDVESGEPTEKVKGLVVIKGNETGIAETFDQVCQKLALEVKP
ncbi:P-loop containing nucleoside triphosphate hydrolase protein [Sistotremastrum suecicum HHB10207 ss-3]|uniref:p-loop containing nucleoside triphosphate hydrolase protein n=1 Tax=Sistotremastrum suecicum HHB10207 ss-3 TaxID=1314776 RepID=A0A165XLI6_9AGAM|nr:P-loop containing nucleoside triphosphate hydrolase protein [Sistotremastrum suecicum HHB10207 ss-3]